MSIGGWNSALVREIFHEYEAGLICNIPLSRYSQPNRIIWRPTTLGEFSVKSACHLDVERKTKENGEGLWFGSICGICRFLTLLNHFYGGLVKVYYLQKII